MQQLDCLCVLFDCTITSAMRAGSGWSDALLLHGRDAAAYAEMSARF